MKDLKFGKFGKFGNEYFELIVGEPCKLIIRKNHISIDHENIGFKKIENDIYLLEVSKDNISSAFFVNTFCMYKNQIFEIGNFINERYILFPSLDYKKKMNLSIYDDNSVDVDYLQFKKNVTKIWEIRKPINDFPFNIESRKEINNFDI
jgi:hypothetical protein